jgi:hypothetical protein
MRIHFVCRTIHDVHAATVRLPPGNAGGKVLVGIGNATVVLFFVFVLFGIGSGVAALPERFNKVVAFFVIGKLFERGSLLVGDDPDHVFVQPLFISLA